MQSNKFSIHVLSDYCVSLFISKLNQIKAYGTASQGSAMALRALCLTFGPRSWVG